MSLTVALPLCPFHIQRWPECPHSTDSRSPDALVTWGMVHPRTLYLQSLPQVQHTAEQLPQGTEEFAEFWNENILSQSGLQHVL